MRPASHGGATHVTHRPGRPTGGASHVHWQRPVHRPVYVQPTYTAPAYGAATTLSTYAAAPTPPAYGVAAPVTAPASNCTCLRKEYTQDNQLVMRDVCTNEVLSGPAGPRAPAQQSSRPAPSMTQPLQWNLPPFTDDPDTEQ
jgi:hypothetical protein